MTAFPMFPLGSVLFPSMPLPVRVFEPRYLTMLSEILRDEPSEFAVVLIERGSEVGGGELRFPVGTIARITDLDASEEFVVLIAEGTRRIQVTEWLEDDPYPKAEIRILDDFEWDDSIAPLRGRAEVAVRSLLDLATRLTGEGWPSDIDLADDPVAACWQLAAIAPLGPLDQIELLASTDLVSMLVSLTDFAGGAEESFRGLYSD
jgi:hypothetical protein